MPPGFIEDNATEETPTVKPRAPKRAPRGDDRKLVENLTQLYSMIGGGVASWGMLKGDVSLVATGNNVIARADDVANTWLELAEQNKAVRRFLEGFTEGSAVASLVGLHLVMAAPFAASRGAVPEQMAMMVMHPEAREATAQYVAKQQEAAMHNGNGIG